MSSTITPIQKTNAGWTGIGPAGDSSFASHFLAIDPTTPTVLYAGTDGNKVYRSTNGGGL